MYAAGSGSDVHVTLRFADGSVGTVSYVTNGSARFPKETLDVSRGGRTGRLDNFRKVEVWSSGGTSAKRARTGQDKGQRDELRRFVEAARTGAPMPIPLDSLVATTRATLAVGTSLATRLPVAW